MCSPVIQYLLVPAMLNRATSQAHERFLYEQVHANSNTITTFHHYSSTRIFVFYNMYWLQFYGNEYWQLDQYCRTNILFYIFPVAGLDCEGVFRVNGNQRVVDKLKLTFDQTGDADFEEAGDIMAVAGLLKLFLRELPDAIIPDSLTGQFVRVQEGTDNHPLQFIYTLLY